MSNLKEKISNIFKKLKSIKHIEIYIALIVALIVCGVYFLNIRSGKSDQNSLSTKNDNNEANFSSSAEYVRYIENKLENVITNVKGVDKANVVVTLEKGFEYIYLTEEETSVTTNGSQITKTSVVMIDGQPVLKEEIYPVVKGIVIVAQGVDDVSVKMNVLSLVQTVINVENSRISIFEG